MVRRAAWWSTKTYYIKGSLPPPPFFFFPLSSANQIRIPPRRWYLIKAKVDSKMEFNKYSIHTASKLGSNFILCMWRCVFVRLSPICVRSLSYTCFCFCVNLHLELCSHFQFGIIDWIIESRTQIFTFLIIQSIFEGGRGSLFIQRISRVNNREKILSSQSGKYWKSGNYGKSSLPNVGSS